MHRYLDEHESAQRSRLVAWNFSGEDHRLHVVSRDRRARTLRASSESGRTDNRVRPDAGLRRLVLLVRSRTNNRGLPAVQGGVRRPEPRPYSTLRVPIGWRTPISRSSVNRMHSRDPWWPFGTDHHTSRGDRRVRPTGSANANRPAGTSARCGRARRLYEVSREGSGDNGADELRCAASTASNYLRKAESRLAYRAV